MSYNCSHNIPFLCKFVFQLRKQKAYRVWWWNIESLQLVSEACMLVIFFVTVYKKKKKLLLSFFFCLPTLLIKKNITVYITKKQFQQCIRCTPPTVSQQFRMTKNYFLYFLDLYVSRTLALEDIG